MFLSSSKNSEKFKFLEFLLDDKNITYLSSYTISTLIANSRAGNRFAYLTLSRLALSLLVTFCVGLKAPNSVCLMSLPAFIKCEVISSVMEHKWW